MAYQKHYADLSVFDAQQPEDPVDKRLRELFSREEGLARVSEVALGPAVHLAGGPCVDSAPPDAEFVPQALGFRVTCRTCRAAAKILGGEAFSQPPTEFARKIIVAHFADHFLHAICGRLDGVFAPLGRETRDNVTCPECLRLMR